MWDIIVFDASRKNAAMFDGRKKSVVIGAPPA
jgi:hypothetical protein